MSIRTARVAEEIQKVLGERLIRGLRDPLPGFVTIRGVEVTSDFTQAKVFVSVFGSDAQKQGAIAGLQHQRGALRHEVGQKIRLRNTPNLTFVLDESSERAARVHALLDEVKQHDAELARQAAATPPPPPAPVLEVKKPAVTPAPVAPAPAPVVEVKKPVAAPAPVATTAAPAAPAAPTPVPTTPKAATAAATTKKAPAKKATKKAPAKPAAKKAPAKKAAKKVAKKAAKKAAATTKKAPAKKATATTKKVAKKATKKATKKG